MNKEINIVIAQINPIVGNFEGNYNKVIDYINKNKSADLIIFPELSFIGYLPNDLLLSSHFIDKILDYNHKIISHCQENKISVILGTILRDNDNNIYNSLIFIDNDNIYNYYKKNLPNYGVFNEPRYFTAGNQDVYINFLGIKIKPIICEDLWQGKLTEQDHDVDLVIAINASPFEINKFEDRIKVSKQFMNGYAKNLIYVNMCGAQDHLVFDGRSFIINQNGDLLLSMKQYQEYAQSFELNFNMDSCLDYKKYNISNNQLIYEALVIGLRDYVEKNNIPGIVLGLSGGVDSALSAIIAIDAIGVERVKCVMLPTKYTSQTSYDDSHELIDINNLDYELFDINEYFGLFVKDFEQNYHRKKVRGLASENLQARLRAVSLMMISNMTGYMLLSTSNKSEIATGYSTIYGDMSGGFCALKNVYKTQVYSLCRWRNHNYSDILLGKETIVIPQNIIDKEPTAELKLNQKDSDNLPNYDVLDKILNLLIDKRKSKEEIIELGFNKAIVYKIYGLLKISEYKRYQGCPGVHIGKISFDHSRIYPIINKY